MASQLFLLFSSSFLISLVLTPVVIKLSKKLHVVDDPQRPHPGVLHQIPIPRAGGVAMFIAFTVVSIFMTEFSPLLSKIIFSRSIIFFVGVIDDIYELSPYL
ncbi:hypothetical protein KC571_03435 [candidate division WWE3 bacterium]|uniref:Undecaprenyl/decaprenyl-phosphate alpha-N-acetylglucosaminyl 1-phosphate transferase n=1 Tax=candidate division WWE3 bacterium TaxID=2053526 RepID=A0A955RQE5_UNCKA|nr:hypothetical protein [candidate division WWE3 bacterium]